MTSTAARLGSWYHGWNIVGVCILAQVASLGVTVNSFTLFVPGWAAEFGARDSTLQLGFTLFALGCSVFAPITGYFGDKYPIRWLLVGGLTGVTAIHAALGFATASWQIFGIYALLMAPAVSFSAAILCQALVTRWFVRQRGLALGLSAFGMATAGVVLPPVIAWLMPLVGWRGVWWLFGGLIALVAIPVILLVVRERPVGPERPAYVGDGASEEPGKLPARDIFRRRNFWIVVASFSTLHFAFSAISMNLASFTQSRGFDLAAAAGLVSIASLAALAAKLVSGILADRFGNRVPLVLSAVACAAGIALASVATTYLALGLAMVMVGLSQAVWTVLASFTAAEFGPRNFGRAFGVISAFTPIGNLGPPIFARIQEVTGDYTAPLVGMAALALAGAVIALFLKEPASRAAIGRPRLAAGE